MATWLENQGCLHRPVYVGLCMLLFPRLVSVILPPALLLSLTTRHTTTTSPPPTTNPTTTTPTTAPINMPGLLPLSPFPGGLLLSVVGTSEISEFKNKVKVEKQFQPKFSKDTQTTFNQGKIFFSTSGLAFHQCNKECSKKVALR